MWRFSIAVLAASMTLLPKTASATAYNFSATEMSALSPSPVSFTFSLDTTTANLTGNSTAFNNVSIRENGTLFSGNSVAASFATDLSSPLFFFVDTSLENFYSGSGTNITFNTGTFAIADGATDGEGTLTISSVPVSPVPEPTTWTLLFTGLAMIFAALRFKRSSEAGRLGC